MLTFLMANLRPTLYLSAYDKVRMAWTPERNHRRHLAKYVTLCGLPRSQDLLLSQLCWYVIACCL